MQQYDLIGGRYSELSRTDSTKTYVQYPSALRLLGDIRGRSVLDIGCGDGFFTRMMARRGAMVTGYDISGNQIGRAVEEERRDPLGIQYHVSTPVDFKSDTRFDKAVSVVVLPYAPDRGYLARFFHSASSHLKDRSDFISIITNPGFRRFGEAVYNRRFTRMGDGKIRVDFLQAGETVVSAMLTDFSRTDYEECVENAGFSSFSWERLRVESKGIEMPGEEFWDGFESDCPYIGLVASKV